MYDRKTMSINLSSKQKKLTVLAIITIAIFALYLINRLLPGYTLSITASPEGSLISVDDKYSSKTKFVKKLSSGSHKIKVSKENYQTEEKKIDLTSDLALGISLNQELKQESFKTNAIKSILPYSVVNIVLLSQESFIGADKRDLSLVEVKNGVLTTLSPGPIKTFSFSNPYVALIKEDSPGKIVLINIKTKNITIIDADSYSPIISVAMSADANDIYFLGNYDPASRSSNFYSAAVKSFSPKKIVATKANRMDITGGNKAVLFETADAIDSGTITIYDLSKPKSVFLSKGNGFVLSPDKNSLFIQTSNKIIFVNLMSFSTRSLSLNNSNKIVWKDNQTLIAIENLSPGVAFYEISLTNLSLGVKTKIKELEKTSIRTAVGYAGNTLFLLDSEGNLLQVKI